MLLGTLIIQSAEVKIKETKFDNPNMIEMSYKGVDGFWLSSYLAGKGAIAINQMNALKQSLGFTDSNFSKKVKHYYKLDYANKILIGVLVGGILLIVGILTGMCIYIGLSIAEKRILLL